MSHELPERATFVSATQDGFEVYTWEQANSQLAYLNPDKENFMRFELSDGSFVQCLGAKKALTVEVRLCREGGVPMHVIARKGELVGTTVVVGGSAGTATVDKSQVLTMRDARSIIREFLEHKRLHSRYGYTDVTWMYSS